VIAKTQLAHLPLRLARHHPAGGPRVFRGGDALRFHHLVQPEEQSLDLGLLARKGQLATGAAGQEEELALTGLADGGHRDAVDRVELEDRHTTKPRAACFEAAA
jgi:hypothetical protein